MSTLVEPILPDLLPTVAQPGAKFISYTNQQGGYSLEFPANWLATEGLEGSIALAFPNGEWSDRIVLSHMIFEKELTQTLIEWAETYYSLGYEPGGGHVFTEVDLGINDPSRMSQQLRMSSPNLDGWKYYISHGQLIWQISTASRNPDVFQILPVVAGSISFAPDAPMNKRELLGDSERVTDSPTLMDMVREREDAKLATDAINVLIQTGQPPIELIAKMSPYARTEYERILSDSSALLTELDRQRNEDKFNATLPDESERYVNTPQFYEDERRYYEQKASEDSLSTEDLSRESDSTLTVLPMDLGPNDFANRKGMPSRITTPVKVYPKDVKCGSEWHYNKDTYAIDIMVNTGTPVFATTQNEVVLSVINPQGQIPEGLGRHVYTRSNILSHGVYKHYIHVYAHLDSINVSPGQTLQPDTQIGLSGSTGTSAAHLHYQIHTYKGTSSSENEGALVPVDISVMKGFLANLRYPQPPASDLNSRCGTIEDPLTTPILIEANEYQMGSLAQYTNYVWTCSTYLPNHTGTCYRAATPISPHWGLSTLDYDSVRYTPRMTYNIWFPTSAIYYVWVCGMGGSVDDDSLYISRNSDLTGVGVDRSVTGYSSSNWVWKSENMSVQRPTLQINSNYNNIDLYIRENGMRVDRILLTPNASYNPVNAGVRCGANSLIN